MRQSDEPMQEPATGDAERPPDPGNTGADENDTQPIDGQGPEPDAALKAEFDAAWRRGLKARAEYSFIRTHKPVIDDSPFRAWSTTAEYRRWCDENVPNWLGYGNH